MTDLHLYDEDIEPAGDWDVWEDEGFSVNVSAKEASSELREFKAVPKGYYLCDIVECDVEQSKSEKNPGKPMFVFQLKVVDGDYTDRTFRVQACLWEGALYTIIQFMKSQGLPVNEGNLKIPPASYWRGRQVTAFIIVKQMFEKNPETNKYDVPVFEDEERTKKAMTNEVKGVKAASEYKGSPSKPKDKSGGAAVPARATLSDQLAPN